ncbi:hypothetical protein M514_25300 [Trichuris suis]|uniref:Uncharacterized protein n=1 Tax=Trichuris suis TaxID=68888 RepID=A0A085MZB8_9BILA|nr:hypothetical protein M514_25300 [Trichuris suis]
MACCGGRAAVFEFPFGTSVSPEVPHVLEKSVSEGKSCFSNIALSCCGNSYRDIVYLVFPPWSESKTLNNSTMKICTLNVEEAW